MDIYTIPIGFNLTNCYLVKFNDNHGIVIDPADNGDKIYNYIEEKEIIIKRIILTHGHFDHIGAVDYLRKKLDVPLSIHSLDNPLLLDPQKNLSFMSMNPIKISPADNLLEDGDIISNFEIIHTAGHTPGGITLYNKENKVLFTGDTIFKNSYGRTDFPGANQETLFNSIENLLKLDGDITIYPGHGPKTSIGEFKQFFY
ncbi:MBL fold metallo-hydrolase [Natronospora cellulosivora (SeqCode)]